MPISSKRYPWLGRFEPPQSLGRADFVTGAKLSILAWIGTNHPDGVTGAVLDSFGDPVARLGSSALLDSAGDTYWLSAIGWNYFRELIVQGLVDEALESAHELALDHLAKSMGKSTRVE